MYRKNFRIYWKEQLTHAAVGMAAGCLLAGGHPAAGAGILALVIARQSLEWGNRAFLPILGILAEIATEEDPDTDAILLEWRQNRDTPGIDLAYHLGGCIVGIGSGVVWLT